MNKCASIYNTYPNFSFRFFLCFHSGLLGSFFFKYTRQHDEIYTSRIDTQFQFSNLVLLFSLFLLMLLSVLRLYLCWITHQTQMCGWLLFVVVAMVTIVVAVDRSYGSAATTLHVVWNIFLNEGISKFKNYWEKRSIYFRFTLLYD